MKKHVPLLGLFLLMMNCTPIKKNTDTVIIKNIQAKELICNRKEGIYMLYGGDYWFHDMKRKEMLNWNSNFVKSLKWDKHKKELLYAAHTKIEPFCSSVGLLYKNAEAKEVADQVAVDLRKKLRAENVFKSEKKLGMYTYILLTYNLPDVQLKTEAKYREYYRNEGKNVLRTVFWSMESCGDWGFVEQEGDLNMEARTPVEPVNEKTGE